MFLRGRGGRGRKRRGEENGRRGREWGERGENGRRVDVAIFMDVQSG